MLGRDEMRWRWSILWRCGKNRRMLSHYHAPAFDYCPVTLEVWGINNTTRSDCHTWTLFTHLWRCESDVTYRWGLEGSARGSATSLIRGVGEWHPLLVSSPPPTPQNSPSWHPQGAHYKGSGRGHVGLTSSNDLLIIHIYTTVASLVRPIPQTSPSIAAVLAIPPVRPLLPRAPPPPPLPHYRTGALGARTSSSRRAALHRGLLLIPAGVLLLLVRSSDTLQEDCLCLKGTALLSCAPAPQTWRGVASSKQLHWEGAPHVQGRGRGHLVRSGCGVWE